MQLNQTTFKTLSAHDQEQVKDFLVFQRLISKQKDKFAPLPSSRERQTDFAKQ